jgi:hypothetical protein
MKPVPQTVLYGEHAYNNGECPLPIVEQVTGNVLGNFFETTIVEYSKNSLTGEWVY